MRFLPEIHSPSPSPASSPEQREVTTGARASSYDYDARVFTATR